MELADINKKLEEELKNTFDIQLDNLPKHAQDFLEELADFQVATGLGDIDSNLIKEWYNIKRKESADLKLKCLPLKSDINKIKNWIVSEENFVQMYEKVLEKNKLDTATAEIDESKLDNLHEELNKLKDNIGKQKQSSEDSEFNLKELCEKIQMLNKYEDNAK